MSDKQKIIELKQSIHALWRALRPLAELAVGPEVIEDRDLVLYKNGGKCLTVGDVLDARAVLGSHP
jgi:hypothetical protein